MLLVLFIGTVSTSEFSLAQAPSPAPDIPPPSVTTPLAQPESASKKEDVLLGKNSITRSFLELPDMFVGLTTRKDRELALKNANPTLFSTIIDEPNGYLSCGLQTTKIVNGTARPITKQVTAFLFPSTVGPVIGVSVKLPDSPDQPRFYYCLNGQWIDVTTRVLPKDLYKKFGFQLPRSGTAINIRRQTKERDTYRLMDTVEFVMLWKNNRFVPDK